ncbi:RNA-directed DNA polymerase, eukaryota, reverse transcriptase zinc-binding domain protein [Tanacetum coccineum]|uniref:RNA-directed DNA polymerase, eukaryota, reverse transcriptase zinc-binding domain protein n=1 Tax=Tanacetum coccineum TaxID=301880 RepID=A0ABQ5EU09_9ASTR
MDIPAISCPSCNANVESANHVFFECDIATDMWKLVFRWCDIPLFQASSWDSFNDWIISWHASKEKKHRFYVITTSVLWWLWRYRNSVTFNSQPLRKSDLFDNVRFSSFSWLHNRDHMKLSWNDWLMKGDYYRYLEEFKSGNVKKEAANQSLKAYQSWTTPEEADLSPTHHIRLGLTLNFFVFYYKNLNPSERPNKILIKLSRSEESYKDSTLSLHLLSLLKNGTVDDVKKIVATLDASTDVVGWIGNGMEVKIWNLGPVPRNSDKGLSNYIRNEETTERNVTESVERGVGSTSGGEWRKWWLGGGTVVEEVEWKMKKRLNH